MKVSDSRRICSESLSSKIHSVLKKQKEIETEIIQDLGKEGGMRGLVVPPISGNSSISGMDLSKSLLLETSQDEILTKIRQIRLNDQNLVGLEEEMFTGPPLFPICLKCLIVFYNIGWTEKHDGV